ncbi:MAG: PQQ-binding-like beta-propeller repeat protein [Planctomycetota bacterium]
MTRDHDSSSWSTRSVSRYLLPAVSCLCVAGALALFHASHPRTASAQAVAIGVAPVPPVPAGPNPGGNGADGKRELPNEYRSGAVPNEPPEAERRLETAQNHFKKREWSAGLALFDEILGEFTAPDRAKKLRNAAIKKRKEFEKVLKELEKAANNPNPNNNKKMETRTEDDILTPTVELTSSDGLRFETIARGLRRQLQALPDEGRDVYRRTYRAPAENALKTARDLSGEDAIREIRRVAERYALTDAGLAAWEELAARLADRGRASEAARALGVRLELAPEDAERGTLLATAAYYELLAENAAGARRLLDEIREEHSEVAIPIRGIAVLGADIESDPLFARLLKEATEASAPPSDWPTVLGQYTHSIRTDISTLPEVGSEARWVYHLSDDPDKRTKKYSAGFPAQQLASYGDTIFVKKKNLIVAIDLKSGKQRWVADPGEAPTSTTTQFGYVRNHDPTADLGGRTLTITKQKIEGEERVVVLAIDHASTMSFDRRTGQMKHTVNRIIGCDAETGKFVWSVGGENQPEGPLKGLSYKSPPTPTAGGLLVAPATREGGFYLVGFKATKNELKRHWVKRLYSFNLSFYQRYSYQARGGSSLASHAGVIYAMPGDGLVSAVDGSSGEVLWSSRYRSSSRAGSFWQHTQPIVVDRDDGSSLLLAAAQDSDYITAFDARTGKELWSKNSYQSSSATVGGHRQVIGVDPASLYLAGAQRIECLSLDDGERRWEFAEDIPHMISGLGFVRGSRIYLSGTRGRIHVFERETGDPLGSFQVLDPNVSTEKPFNLFPIGTSLLALNQWGLVSLRPQDETWKLLGSKNSGTRQFRRARLLRGAGQFQEALDILYDLESKYRESVLHARIKKDILLTVQEAVTASDDATYVTKLLEYRKELLPKLLDQLSWRLREADLIAEGDRELAIERFFGLLRYERRLARTQSGDTVDVGLYASDRLRHLLQHPAAKKDADGKEEKTPDPILLSESLETYARLAKEEARTNELLTTKMSRTTLHGVVTRRSHTPSATTASAFLSVLASSEKRPIEAYRHLARLLGDYPALAKDETLQAKLRELKSAMPVEPTPPFRWESDVWSGVKSESTRESADFTSAPWQSTFWHDVEQGVPAASAVGSDPLPFCLSLIGADLVVFDFGGAKILSRELPDFPDVAEVKAKLDSSQEEPLVAHFKDNVLVVFTAAGIYGFEVKVLPPEEIAKNVKAAKAKKDDSPGADTEIDDGIDESLSSRIDPSAFRVIWYHTYRHALQDVRGSRYSFSSIRLNTTKNLFPEIDFDSKGHPRVLMPDGEFFGVHRKSGKLTWRIRSAGYELRGRPIWKGDAYEVLTVSPPGILRYAIGEDGETPKAGVEPELISGAKRLTTGAHLAGIASVYYGSGLTVMAPGGRVIWKRPTSALAMPARVTPNELWTSGYGELHRYALRSGRELGQIPLPKKSRVIAVFQHPKLDEGGVTVLTSAAVTRSTGIRYYRGRTETGTGLWIIRLNQEGEVQWTIEVDDGPVTYLGSRTVLPDGRWVLTYNAKEPESDKWYTRVSIIDPSRAVKAKAKTDEKPAANDKNNDPWNKGAVRLWLETEVAGKGTGQVPRLCAVGPGVVLGNADGFGWFREVSPPAEEPAEADGESNPTSSDDS